MNFGRYFLDELKKQNKTIRWLSGQMIRQTDGEPVNERTLWGKLNRNSFEPNEIFEIAMLLGLEIREIMEVVKEERIFQLAGFKRGCSLDHHGIMSFFKHVTGDDLISYLAYSPPMAEQARKGAISNIHVVVCPQLKTPAYYQINCNDPEKEDLLPNETLGTDAVLRIASDLHDAFVEDLIVSDDYHRVLCWATNIVKNRKVVWLYK
ncbi:hypothetical protein GTO89_11445 [Heliobacterium gestii]|uniref:Uncharacterized protein n=1 Tax=Heliomicrobium gestii TaxID=2699 RepID=A0A845LGV5_HELGE|nr:hypothetical protein [Heliomicrobium gestii]MBM7867390.1 hypothetical protein [Heliomicrobium gestii]MZP43655.1 hypothetical protein [Heliomicrobium gestii]